MAVTDAGENARSAPTAPRHAEPSIHVVGFAGSVSRGAAAIKAPIFEIDGLHFSGDADSPPRTTYRWEDLEEYQDRGLVTLVSQKCRRLPEYVFLYADRAFLRPAQEAFDLHGDLDSLAWDERAQAFCDYMHRDRALVLLGRWAELLLGHSRKMLWSRAYQEAKESAQRARFGATREHPTLRSEAHRYVLAARLGLGQDIEGALRHVEFDFSVEVARQVKQQAHLLFRQTQRQGSNWGKGERRYPVQFARSANAFPRPPVAPLHEAA